VGGGVKSEGAGGRKEDDKRSSPIQRLKRNAKKITNIIKGRGTERSKYLDSSVRVMKTAVGNLTI